jgi:hypothetical protein
VAKNGKVMRFTVAGTVADFHRCSLFILLLHRNRSTFKYTERYEDPEIQGKGLVAGPPGQGEYLIGIHMVPGLFAEVPDHQALLVAFMADLQLFDEGGGRL